MEETLRAKSPEFLSFGSKQHDQANGRLWSTVTPVSATRSRSQTAFPRSPRPFIKQRSITDKFVDYILGDGVSQRFAYED